MTQNKLEKVKESRRLFNEAFDVFRKSLCAQKIGCIDCEIKKMLGKRYESNCPYFGLEDTFDRFETLAYVFRKEGVE